MPRRSETPASASPSLPTEVRRRCDSLLGTGSFEIVWEEEPRTVRDPYRADRIAADVPVIAA